MFWKTGLFPVSIPREELFIITKLWIQDAGYENARKAFQVSLDKLGLDYIDACVILGYIHTEPFSEIEKLSEITDESLKKYKTPGVWVLFGRNEDKIWLCLQVGQSDDIGSEIKSDVQCISGNIKEQTNRTYINQFGNVVNGYRYNIYLTPREQIYKQIGEKYLEFVFICICCGNDCKDKKKSIEKYVAWKFRALFWRNGGAFKNQNDNVKEPQDIDKIAFDEKKSVDKMVEMYDAQKRIYT